MIGLSLSFCVSDIAVRGLDIKKIDKIITGTRCRDESEWNELITEYQQTYWRKFPIGAELIVRDLLRAGKIVQPRLEDNRHFPMLGKTGFWVESEDQIEWSGVLA